MSKGSAQRQFDIKKFNDNFDKIFGKKVADRVKTVKKYKGENNGRK